MARTVVMTRQATITMTMKLVDKQGYLALEGSRHSVGRCASECGHSHVYSVEVLTIKPKRCINSSNLFLEWSSTCFGQFHCPSSGV
jgi:hypothetical protein